MKLMAFSLTLPQLLLGMKDVTRRSGWQALKKGATLMAVDRQMGLKKGEMPVRIAPIFIKDVRRERLDAMTGREAAREGFPGMPAEEFIERFSKSMKSGDAEVTRIEFEFAEGEPCIPAAGCQVIVNVGRKKRLPGVVVGHVGPGSDPCPLGMLVAKSLGLHSRPPLGAWKIRDAARAMVLKSDGKLSLMPSGMDAMPAHQKTTAADIVFSHTINSQIRTIARQAQELNHYRESCACISRNQ